jgi:predicted thioesterase
VFAFIARPASDAEQVLGAGTAERVVVDREGFLARLG